MGNHLFSATDLMSLLLSLCCALLFRSLLSPPPASLYFWVLVLSKCPPSRHPPLPNVTPYSLQSTPVDCRFVFFPSSLLSHATILCSSSSGPLQALRLSNLLWTVFSTSCSQWVFRVCIALTSSASVKHSRQRRSVGCLHYQFDKTTQRENPRTLKTAPIPSSSSSPSSASDPDSPPSPSPCPDELIHLQPPLMA